MVLPTFPPSKGQTRIISVLLPVAVRVARLSEGHQPRRYAHATQTVARFSLGRRYAPTCPIALYGSNQRALSKIVTIQIKARRDIITLLLN